MKFHTQTPHVLRMLELGGPWLSGRALASGSVGSEFNPPPGHGWCGRQASLTLAMYSVFSSYVSLVLKSRPKALQSLCSLLIIMPTINKYNVLIFEFFFEKCALLMSGSKGLRSRSQYIDLPKMIFGP